MKGLCIAFESENMFPRQMGMVTHFPHTPIQGLLSSMPERRMTQIVGESGGLGQLRDQASVKQRMLHYEVMGDRPGNLRSFDAVRQPRAIKIRLPDAENLRLPLQPPKSSTVQDAVPIPLSRVPMIFGRGRRFFVAALQQKLVHWRSLRSGKRSTGHRSVRTHRLDSPGIGIRPRFINYFTGSLQFVDFREFTF